jgi:hypothetical protein
MVVSLIANAAVLRFGRGRRRAGHGPRRDRPAPKARSSVSGRDPRLCARSRQRILPRRAIVYNFVDVPNEPATVDAEAARIVDGTVQRDVRPPLHLQARHRHWTCEFDRDKSRGLWAYRRCGGRADGNRDSAPERKIVRNVTANANDEGPGVSTVRSVRARRRARRVGPRRRERGVSRSAWHDGRDRARSCPASWSGSSDFCATRCPSPRPTTRSCSGGRPARGRRGSVRQRAGRADDALVHDVRARHAHGVAGDLPGRDRASCAVSPRRSASAVGDPIVGLVRRFVAGMQTRRRAAREAAGFVALVRTRGA